MYRSNRSFSNRRSSRFRGAPVARKQRVWIYTTSTQLEVAATPTYIPMFTGTDWAFIPATGAQQQVKVIRQLVLLSATQDDTTQSRQYVFGIDDASTSVANGPDQAAFWNTFKHVYRWGALYIPPTTESPVPAAFSENRDAIREVTYKARIRRDDVTWLVISAAAAGNLVTYTWACRTLIELG